MQAGTHGVLQNSQLAVTDEPPEDGVRSDIPFCITSATIPICLYGVIAFSLKVAKKVYCTWPVSRPEEAI